MTLYNGYYCGLCDVLGREYGVTRRMLLNYDCAFIAALLDGLSGHQPLMQKKCPFKPLKAKRPFAKSSPALKFSAALNVLLTYYKLRDDWDDEKKLYALTASRIIKRAAKKASKKYPKLNESIRTGLSGLSALESSGCPDIDAVANGFAKLLADALESAPIDSEQNRKAMYSLSFNVGRWIYLVDAWHDRERDKKSGDYNVFNITRCEKERARMLLEIALNQATRAYDLLDIRENRDLLDNVIYMGCFEKTMAVLESDCDKKRSRSRKNKGTKAKD